MYGKQRDFQTPELILKFLEQEFEQRKMILAVDSSEDKPRFVKKFSQFQLEEAFLRDK